MKVYHEAHSTMRYIVIQESELKDSVLGLTVNRMLIIVGKNNRRINEFECPKTIYLAYKQQVREAEQTPDYQLCLYFGSQDKSNINSLI